MKRLSLGLACCLTAGAFATSAMAGVPASQAARLGSDLTPMGSERAGSGNVPAWSGGLSSVPSNVTYDAGSGKQLPDPFASDQIQYTVTPGNMAQYSDQLTTGYQALLSTYPSYKMNVYQGRRTCAFPDAVNAATRNNAEVGSLVGGGNGVGGAINGFPFPIPSSGLEIVWNHTLRYRDFKITRQTANAAVTRSGDYDLIISQQDVILRWSDPRMEKAEDLDNISIYFIANTVAPARAAGSVILVHETLDRSIDPRKAWQYSPGTRRVRRAPNIAYDNPGTNSDGLSTSDSFDMYNGAPDRYDWTVLGKREVFISANNYRLQQAEATYEDIVNPGHANQDLVRYERRRVWEIEGNLKSATRHVYSRRQMVMDEDGWSIAATSLYDGRGELWRAQERWSAVAYDHPLCNSAGDVVYDLNAGRYLAGGLNSQEAPVNYDASELNIDRYTPGSIRQLGVR